MGSEIAVETPQVVLNARGARRARGLHPWVYASDIASRRARTGDVVSVLDPQGRLLGTAFYNDASQISVRFIDRGEVAVDRDFWISRLSTARAQRQALGIDGDAYRLVHAEADRLPGLVVDRYGDCLVLQLLTATTERFRDEIVECLVELESPRAIVARNDSRTRKLEGLPQEAGALHGEPPKLQAIRDGDVRMEVDLLRGQKTGLFLDQRENRAAARQYARGRLLDCFSYNGAFALQLAGRCDEVIAVDMSKDAVRLIERNAALNDVELEARQANVFDHLRELQDRAERFDTIVLDPPAFAKNKGAIAKALKGYKDINLRAMKLLRPGGCLVTASCSYHVGDQAFLDVVTEAARDVKAEMTLLERRGQSRDHPVRLGMPESGYLKCLILRRQA
jgi:23S rRNA (cytosine1962-C5)-methyltransferase